MDTVTENPSLMQAELKRLARFMRPDHPMRSTLDGLISQDYARLPSSDLYLGILEGASHQRLRDCILAAEALKFVHLTRARQTRVEQALLDIIEPQPFSRIVRKSANFLNLVLKLLGLIITSIALAAIFGAFNTESLIDFGHFVTTSIWLALFVGALALVFVTPIVYFAVERRDGLRLRQISAESLGRIGATNSIGVLVTAAANVRLHHSACSALCRVISRIQNDDCGHVDSSSMVKLAGVLQSEIIATNYPNLIPVVLDALEKVGTGVCVSDVEWMAASSVRFEWRGHAARILPILLERRELERNATSLLRASNPEPRSNDLLRPASSAPLPDDKTLLQPASNPIISRGLNHGGHGEHGANVNGK